MPRSVCEEKSHEKSIAMSKRFLYVSVSISFLNHPGKVLCERRKNKELVIQLCSAGKTKSEKLT